MEMPPVITPLEFDLMRDMVIEDLAAEASEEHAWAEHYSSYRAAYLTAVAELYKVTTERDQARAALAKLQQRDRAR